MIPNAQAWRSRPRMPGMALPLVLWMASFMYVVDGGLKRNRWRAQSTFALEVGSGHWDCHCCTLASPRVLLPFVVTATFFSQRHFALENSI